MKKIENLLRCSIGLDSATVGASLVEHTIRSRMARLGLTCHDAYLELLRKSPAEWNSLVEALVVTETWFFREKQPFVSLVRLVLEEWLVAHPAEMLRLLSVPCASGEEPYSLAMALIDGGVPATRFEIDAVDISARALAFAQRGVFGRNSFRGGDLEFRNRHFASTKHGYVLNPAVRRLVRFQRGNILAADCLAGAGIYHFVFCRNLLIYFDRQTQTETLAKLGRLLTPGGVLFTSAAELPMAIEHSFAPLDLPKTFACRKTAPESRPPACQNTPLLSVSPPPARPARALVLDRPDTDLARARELAATGQLDEAANLCHSHLREQGVSAEAFYILGLVQDSSGADAEAGECYRKALYLEPGHLDALHRWAVLSEKNGQREQARRLRARAERQQPDLNRG